MTQQISPTSFPGAIFAAAGFNACAAADKRHALEAAPEISMEDHMPGTITVAAVCVSLLLLSVTACTTVAPSQGYRSAGSTAAPWQISGEMFDFTNVKIFINGTKVIDERLSLITGDGEFHASYNGKQIMASCSTSAGLLLSSTKCIVFVDNERSATLSF